MVVSPELRALLAQPEVVILPDGKPVEVRPLTFAEWDELAKVEPREDLRTWEFQRLVLWLVLKDVPEYACTYPEWCELMRDAESLARLRGVVEAWLRVNKSFRRELFGGDVGLPPPVEPGALGHPPVGNPGPAHAGATLRARLRNAFRGRKNERHDP